MTAPALGLRYDLRLPDADSAARKRHLDVALEQIRWAEQHGFSSVTLSEHHGSLDGYLPSPIVFGASIAASTSSLFVHLGALIAPLHDPIRLAEDLAILDLLLGGLLIVTVGAGYVEAEFEMFGRDIKRRPTLVEEAISTLRAAWSGGPFEYQGRTVRVTPRPFQDHIPILLGGQTAAAARRAARLADGYAPAKPESYQDYRDAVVALGRPDPGPLPPYGPRFLYVADDPERAWAQIGPALLHETNAYAHWATCAGLDTGYYPAADIAELRATSTYEILTPDECVDLCQRLGGGGNLIFHPLAGGLDPDLASASLDLFASDVLPRL